MSVFRGGHVLAGEFNDFDALASATADWDVTYSQVGGGAFTGTLEIATTGAVQIIRQRWSAPLLVEGGQPRGAVSFGIIVDTAGEVRSHGSDFQYQRTMIGGLPGHEVHLMSLARLDVVAVSIELGLFQRHAAALLGIEWTRLGRNLQLHMLPGAAACPARGQALGAMLQTIASNALRTPAARHYMQEAAVHTLLDGVTVGAVLAEVPLTVRRRAARAAEEVLRARLDDPPSLAELCQATGASERTLHAAFQDCYGLPPKRYLRVLRLNAARRRLRRGGGKVTEIAADLGFFHFARFSAEYREFFNELPSETLRRARQEVGLPRQEAAGRQA